MASHDKGFQAGKGDQRTGIGMNSMVSNKLDGGLQNFYVYSLNVNGINDRIKRRMLFSDLKKYKRGIFCLQETHLQEAILPILRTQWGQRMIEKGNSS